MPQTEDKPAMVSYHESVSRLHLRYKAENLSFDGHAFRFVGRAFFVRTWEKSDFYCNFISLPPPTLAQTLFITDYCVTLAEKNMLAFSLP